MMEAVFFSEAMVKGQRWKVLERDGVIAREGAEDSFAHQPVLVFGTARSPT